MAKSKSKSNTKQDLLYIKSESCGWCKKADPVVDELLKDGVKITTLDVMNPEDQKRINEVKQKYSAQCGTPFFIDAESGNQICGFREKDVLQKWVNGEEIPKPPQPKSPPPPPPTPEMIDDEKSVADWKVGYEKWAKENKHLPKIMPFDQIHQRVKQSYEMRAKQEQNAPQGGGNLAGTAAADGNASISSTSYYQFIGGKKELVMADAVYVNSLKHQYLQRESSGSLVKVVGDPKFTGTPTPPAGRAPAVKPVNTPQPQAPKNKVVDDKVKKQLKAMKDSKSKTEQKSKSNKKEIANF